MLYIQGVCRVVPNLSLLEFVCYCMAGIFFVESHRKPSELCVVVMV